MAELSPSSVTNSLTISAARNVVNQRLTGKVKFEQTAQSVATVNGPAPWHHVPRTEEEKIGFALVVPFKMMMDDVLV